MTLHQAIEEVDGLDNDEAGGRIEHAQMMLLPLDQVGALSDEKRIDEDDSEAAVPTDVAEQVRIENIDEEDEDDDIPLARFLKEGYWRKTEKLKKVPVIYFPEKLIEAHPDLLDLSPVQRFKFSDQSVIDLLIKASTSLTLTRVIYAPLLA